MNIKTLDNGLFEATAEILDGLKMQLKGQLLQPGEAGYEDVSTVWNAMIDRKPALVVRCLGTVDVIASVNFAHEHNLLLCIKAGGHNIAGLAVAEGAIMLDLSLMRGVWVDPIGKIAHAQAGCLIGDVDRETQLHGLATVLGFVSLTGIAGLTLGGGIGYLTRRFGWTVDNVVGMDVVTAQGKLVRASADENAELFWGLKGGGGNFGVVTGFDYRLYPVGPQVLGGFIAWPASEAPKVVELFRKQAQDAPDELTLVCIMRPAPPAPWLPKEAHGTPVVMLGACYTGNIEEGEKLLAPIKTFGAPIGDNLVRRPYSQLQILLDGANPKGRRCYWRSEYLPAIEPAMTDKFIEHAAKIQSPFSAVILFQLGGALAKLDDSAAPAGNRDAGYVLNLTAAWTQPEDDQANIQWVRQAWNDMKAYSTGAAYINFLSDDEGPERTQASYGENMNRLAEIKAKWDPQNFFRSNRNIVPALVTMTSQR